MADKYPEHQKLKAREHDAGLLSEFLDFMNYEKGWIIAQYIDGSERLFAIRQRPEQIIGLFLGVDPKKLEAEKVAMIDELRKAAGND